MTAQSTIDRINDAIVALGQQKDLLLRGNADRPNSEDVLAAESRVRLACYALDVICFEYDVSVDDRFINAADEIGFADAADNADERLREQRGPRWTSEEAYR